MVRRRLPGGSLPAFKAMGGGGLQTTASGTFVKLRNQFTGPQPLLKLRVKQQCQWISHDIISDIVVYGGDGVMISDALLIVGLGV